MFSGRWDSGPPGLLFRILECAIVIAVSGFLIRLGVRYFLEVWWVLLIIILVAGGAVIGWRIWRNRHNTKW